MFFITFTVNHWHYIFDRHKRWKILLSSLKYCQEHKNLRVFAYVFMLNHIHLIVQSPDASGFVRDFKKYTSLEMKKNFLETEYSAVKLFLNEEGKWQFWQKTNMPIVIESDEVFFQKKQYIELNPVQKEYVASPEDWLYSSAHSPSLLSISHLYDSD